MPIFHDPLDLPPAGSAAAAHSRVEGHATNHGGGYSSGGRRLLESVSAENVTQPSARSGSDVAALLETSSQRAASFNRAELIERLKRGNSPPWSAHHQNNGKYVERSRPGSRDRPSTPLLPAAELKSSRTSTPDPLRDNASAGIEIERPGSALHSGDFREKKDDSGADHASANVPVATSPVVPWHHMFPAAAYPPQQTDSQFGFRDALNYEARMAARSRATSQSFSPSLVLMPPTSPLVQQSNNPDLDSRPSSRHASRSPERQNLRHTFSPHSFQSFKASQMARSISGTPTARHMKTENALPYQAHQPRRSMTSLHQIVPHSLPQTPCVFSRRPSFSEASPIQHAPMVGSYEESILRGRMSTTPSKPLNFLAQIGVLGKGQCPPKLKCPRHVTVPFPAVFYCYNNGNGRIADNSPSPYVGHIDLENSLSPCEESTDGARRKRRHTVDDEVELRLNPQDEHPSASQNELRRRQKNKRRSTSPKAPPGGSYRIPQQGQLQIVIKNPNKTAVKLFLVPYDLSDMEPGQKTFIRQRSYSAGPIIDMPLSSRKNLGTDRPEAALSNSDDPNDRPVLRYLIHLHICCPSKGRYFLYKAVRVVFANRVPDGKEKLRNEIQMPEPRYSTYKASRDSLSSQNPSSVAAQVNSERALKRRSTGHTLHQTPAPSGRRGPTPVPHAQVLPPPAVQFSGGNEPVPTYFDPYGLAALSSHYADSRTSSSFPDTPPRDPMEVDPHPESPLQSRTNHADGRFSCLEDRVSSRPWPGQFQKMERTSVPASPGTGLLARRLKGLDVKRDEDEECSG